MKNKTFYSIEKGQLVSIWLFGIIGTIYSINAASEEDDLFFGFLAIGIAFFLVFYTLGWMSSRKNNITN